ncbi:MAG: hypothetical protein GF419_00090 [Ignavibacteriales bacterium]|nr:hypothetical protein [Ignavibacteriales bacterium]
MKKGCFIKLVVVLTLLVAFALYVVQNKLDDWVLDPAKGYLADEATGALERELTFIEDSPAKDSLLSYFNRSMREAKFLKIEDFDTLRLENFGDSVALKSFEESLGYYAADSILTEAELERLIPYIDSLTKNGQE